MQAIGVSQIQWQYAQQSVVYLLGEEDNNPNDPTNELDTDCEAKLQGEHRLERGTIFYNYIQHYYGAAIQSQHTKVIVPGVGHSARGMFNSPEGIQQIFHDIVDSQVLQPCAVVLQACASLLLLQGDRPAPASPATTVLRHYAGAIQASTTASGVIDLAAPAPPEGKLIKFTSSDSALVRIPNVIVPAGKTTATFSIQIADNAANATVTLTAVSDFTKQVSLSIPARTIQTLLLGTKAGFNANVYGIAANGKYIYAAHYYSKIENANETFGKGELVVIDSTTFKEVPNTRIPVGFAPRSVAVNPLTNRLYVVNRGATNVEPDQQGFSFSIVEINPTDASKLKEITQLRLGIGVIDVAVNTQTNRIYVTNYMAKSIHVINGETNQELQAIQLPFRPLGITVDEKTNTLYVATSDRNVNPFVNAVIAVKITGETGDQTQSQIETIPIHVDPENPDPTRPTQPVDVAFNPETNSLYAANLGGVNISAPCVTVINLTTREATTVKTISGARAIAVNPLLNQVYIGTDSGVQVMDGATNTIVSTIPNKAHWGIAINPTTNQIYAGSPTEGTITQIVAPDLSTITQWT
jgi:DNA-binding beta-propeller fold protein YncE